MYCLGKNTPRSTLWTTVPSYNCLQQAPSSKCCPLGEIPIWRHSPAIFTMWLILEPHSLSAKNGNVILMVDSIDRFVGEVCLHFQARNPFRQVPLEQAPQLDVPPHVATLNFPSPLHLRQWSPIRKEGESSQL